MKQDIENIIKKNLPEKRYRVHDFEDGNSKCIYCGELRIIIDRKVHSRIVDEGSGGVSEEVTIKEIDITGMPCLKNPILGFNQALSQINTSLIVDEVLKVVVEFIKDGVAYGKFGFSRLDKGHEGEIAININDILQELGNLSPNKENK